MTAPRHPTLTIVIPTFNSINDLPACIESVRNILDDLIGKTVFVVIQDGQSTDGTIDYVQRLNTVGITLISEQDNGVYDAMNKAIKRIETEWIYFLGADDRLLSGFRTMFCHLKNINTIYYANVRFSSNGRKYDGPFSAFKLVLRNICHQSMFFPSQILKKEPYSLEYPIKSDWAKNICLFANVPFQYVDIDVAIFNDGVGLSSAYKDSCFENDKARLFYESNGYWLKFACLVAPIATWFFHLVTKRRRRYKHIRRKI